MQINLALPDLAGTGDLLKQLATGVRILAGELPELASDQVVPAQVVRSAARQTVVQLLGKQLVVEELPGFAAGDELYVQINTRGPQPLLQVLPRPPQATGLPNLRVGQQLPLELLQQLPDGRVLVDLQGSRLEATVPDKLPVGNRLAVVVEQVQPEVVLRVLDPPQTAEAGAAQLLRDGLPQRLPVGEALASLDRALAQDVPEAIPPAAKALQAALKEWTTSDSPPTPERIARLVRDGGLQYEAKLSQALASGSQGLRRVAAEDMKALLLRTLREVQPPPTGHEIQSPVTSRAGMPTREPLLVPRGRLTAALQPSDPSRAVTLPEVPAAKVASGPPTGPQATVPAAATVSRPEPTTAPLPTLTQTVLQQLSQIETQQAINVLAQVHGGPYQLQIPFGEGNRLTTAFFSVEREDSDAEEPTTRSRGFNLYFHLDLENLGELKIDSHITPRSLRAIFYTARPDAQVLLQDELPQFRASLQSQGYDEVLLGVRPLAQLAAGKRQKFADLTRGVPEGLRLLDVRA